MVTIIQGEDRNLNIGILDSSENIQYDLTGVDGISIKLPATSSGSVEFTLAASEIDIVDAVKGRITLKMSDAKTIGLKTGELTMEIILDKGAPTSGDRRIVQVEKAVLVKKKLY